MKTPLIIAGLAGAVLLMAGSTATAQLFFSYGNTDDPWTHMTAAGANGQCWIATDRPYYDRGTGYWGNCPNMASATAARAEEPIRHKTVHKRMKRTPDEMER